MFAGIVEEAAQVYDLEIAKSKKILVVQSSLDHSETKEGDSIAIDGVCLTVVSKTTDGHLSFDLAEETLRRTCLGQLEVGSVVNLERSLRVGDRISGHFVFGHVDTTAQLTEKISEGVDVSMTWKLPAGFMRFIATKGSVSLAGVSLTVGEVEDNSFKVYIIPHTLSKTKLGSLEVGNKVNVEIDMLARYVVAAVDAQHID